MGNLFYSKRTVTESEATAHRLGYPSRTRFYLYEYLDTVFSSLTSLLVLYNFISKLNFFDDVKKFYFILSLYRLFKIPIFPHSLDLPLKNRNQEKIEIERAVDELRTCETVGKQITELKIIKKDYLKFKNMKETDISTKEYYNSRLDEFKEQEKINWLNSTFSLAANSLCFISSFTKYAIIYKFSFAILCLLNILSIKSALKNTEEIEGLIEINQYDQENNNLPNSYTKVLDDTIKNLENQQRKLTSDEINLLLNIN